MPPSCSVGMLAAAAMVLTGVEAYDNGVALTPPMGWNSWNHFGCRISADVLATTADAFVDLGLRDAGYVFINTDDCWSEKVRDNHTGRIVPSPLFGGTDAAMKNLSAYIRSKGMKFGIYGAAGQTTCASRAGGLYHEYLDAQTYADWGAEYLKYDDCGQNNINSYAKFSAMRDGLNRTGVPIVYSFEPHLTIPIEWTQYVGNLWRTGHDIGSNFKSMFSELVIGNSWASIGGAGNWNDDDMLEVGNQGLTIAEQRTHFGLWCMVKSPLLIGSDVRSIAPESLSLLLNKELIAINQDPLGKQAILTAVYHSTNRNAINMIQDYQTRNETPANLQGRFDSSSQYMTTCDYGPGFAPPAQRWKFSPASNGYSIIQSEDGTKCLSSNLPGLIDCEKCGTDCHWDTSSGYSGENGNRGKANETTAQIKSAANGWCLKFSAASRGGKGLYMEPCNVDPPECITKRCFYSLSLGDEEWYLSDNGQLIASFVRGDGHQIPPSSIDSNTAVSFSGPFPGLGGPEATSDRCGNLRGASDMGVTPMCKNTTSDGRIYVTLAEIEARCSADAHCAGFSQDTQDGPAYFRPLSQIKLIVADKKWTTWTKGPPPPGPPSPPPSPPVPNDWFDQVDPPFCLATEASSNPPKEPPQPPQINKTDLQCSDSHPTLLVFAGPLADGDIAVGLVNPCSGVQNITATWKDIGAKSGIRYNVRDVISKRDLPPVSETISATVEEHDIAVFRLSPQNL